MTTRRRSDAWHGHPPLSRRQQAQPWGEDTAGAIGRLSERCEQLRRQLHEQQRTLHRLQQSLAREQRENTLLRQRLARQRHRGKPTPPEQLRLL